MFQTYIRFRISKTINNSKDVTCKIITPLLISLCTVQKQNIQSLLLLYLQERTVKADTVLIQLSYTYKKSKSSQNQVAFLTRVTHTQMTVSNQFTTYRTREHNCKTPERKEKNKNSFNSKRSQSPIQSDVLNSPLNHPKPFPKNCFRSPLHR